MKELSIEEKAKAYDEAIKRAKELLEIGVKDTRDKRVVLSFFPELAESKGETIRKELINYCYERLNTTYGALPNIEAVKRWLAWLEKQGETFTKRDVDDAYLKGLCDAKRELEKQGEQKSVDKIEPKFNMADWIVMNNGKAYQVISVNEYFDEYILTGCDGRAIKHSIQETDKSASIFTIQDAKDGDVLEFGDHGRLVVGIVSYVNKTTGKVDVNCLLENNNFKVGNYYNLDTIKPHPTTKEQRDLLFQRMKEAGYELNAEKKELIKL